MNPTRRQIGLVVVGLLLLTVSSVQMLSDSPSDNINQDETEEAETTKGTSVEDTTVSETTAPDTTNIRTSEITTSEVQTENKITTVEETTEESDGGASSYIPIGDSDSPSSNSSYNVTTVSVGI